MVAPTSSGPLEALDRMRAAAIAQSAGQMGRVYAPDAVHEFPFTRPGAPARMEGRDAIIGFITAFWETSPLRYERYRTIAIHQTADPDTIVVEQEVAGTSTTTGSFVLPNLLVLQTRDGQITHLRDYANLPALADVLGARILNLFDYLFIIGIKAVINAGGERLVPWIRLSFTPSFALAGGHPYSCLAEAKLGICPVVGKFLFIHRLRQSLVTLIVLSLCRQIRVVGFASALSRPVVLPC
jgi:ketosteroid isomerase-like protein